MNSLEREEAALLTKYYLQQAGSGAGSLFDGAIYQRG